MGTEIENDRLVVVQLIRWIGHVTRLPAAQFVVRVADLESMSEGLRPPAALMLRAALLVLPASLVVTVSLAGGLRSEFFVSPTVLFLFILVVASLCAIGGLVVLKAGWSRRSAEVAIFGAAIVTASALPLVHGLTTPGVLFTNNDGTRLAAFLTVPSTLVVAFPVLAGHNLAMAKVLLRHWRLWTIGALAVTGVGSMFLLRTAESLSAPSPNSPIGIAGMTLSVAGMGWWAARQLRLYVIGRQPGSVIAAVAAIYLGLSAVTTAGTEPYSIAFWASHFFDAIGVFGLIVGALMAYRRHEAIGDVLGPVINRDPIVALEYGLHPLVHQFVSELDEKDPITRDHVIRVGELAMRVGERAGLSASRLRALGIGALMHDVGKLFTPDEILNKPGALTDDEFAIIKDHTKWGAELMMSSPILADSANFVRWHHERPDGTGYPDQLTSAEIPLEVAIISVCDTWDAMTFDRQYREALSPHQASAILTKGVGTQWSERAVNLLLDEIHKGGPVRTPRLEQVGRNPDDEIIVDDGPRCVCEDALPQS